jgi:chromatin segregation and condensation protein Rec8/ScpA/Scc1 (kleisin family)
MIERVLRMLSETGETRFGRLAADCRDGHELRTAFFSVLVLIRRRVIDADQSAPFGEITLRRRPVSRPFPVEYGAVEAADD